MHVVRLLAPRLDNENHTKDIDFSPTGIRVRWEAGYADTARALQRAAWDDDCDPLEGVILHRCVSHCRQRNRASRRYAHHCFQRTTTKSPR